jgi:hypothetical protein
VLSRRSAGRNRDGLGLLDPTDSKGMELLIAQLYATPKDVVEKAAQAVAK